VLGRFTDLDLRHPHLIAPSAWDWLTSREKAVIGKRGFINSREWMPHDRRRFSIEPEGYRTRYSVASVGQLRAHRIGDSLAMQFVIQLTALEVVRIVIFERGGAQLVVPGGKQPQSVPVSTGAIYYDAPGFRAITSDDNSRLMLTLPTRLLRYKLEALLEGRQVGSIAFQGMFDATRGAGATIRRMTNSLFVELAQSDSLLTNEIAIRSFEEHLTLCVLLGLPHNYSSALQRQKAMTTPASVRRAEEFLRAYAGEAITIEKIAHAVGCSVRALQRAFLQFREMTPMEALRRVRLEQAREELIRPAGSGSVIETAAKFGFTNAGRFASQYKNIYGEYPSESLRRRGSL
jgi:AraC-like DNA-binding protein